MKVRVFYHDKCFDGACSAALFSRFYRERIREHAEFEYVGLVHRAGALFWRMHRCARIIFSLGFHLEKMTPKECIDLLVDRIGHERDNATAEVRRSFERYVNKMLHPPLERIRDESRRGHPHGLLEALKRLFHLRD